MADFGQARGVAAQGQSMSMTLLGSPAYMAPELLKAVAKRKSTLRYSTQADIYSLGLVAYVLFKKDLKNGKMRVLLGNLSNQVVPKNARGQNTGTAYRFLKYCFCKVDNIEVGLIPPVSL